MGQIQRNILKCECGSNRTNTVTHSDGTFSMNYCRECRRSWLVRHDTVGEEVADPGPPTPENVRLTLTARIVEHYGIKDGDGKFIMTILKTASDLGYMAGFTAGRFEEKRMSRLTKKKKD